MKLLVVLSATPMQLLELTLRNGLGPSNNGPFNLRSGG